MFNWPRNRVCRSCGTNRTKTTLSLCTQQFNFSVRLAPFFLLSPLFPPSPLLLPLYLSFFLPFICFRGPCRPIRLAARHHRLTRQITTRWIHTERSGEVKVKTRPIEAEHHSPLIQWTQDRGDLDPDIAHSRSASDSSTRKLTTADRLEDPYAKRTSRSDYDQQQQHLQRANSYLPYSHHQRDPLAPVAPIYIEERTTSVLTDKDRTISLQPEHTDVLTTTDERRPVHALQQPPPELPFTVKRKRKTCWRRRHAIFAIAILVAAVIAVIWYFVWPRVPSFEVTDADDVAVAPVISKDTGIYNTTWRVTLSIDNSANWVPTRIENLLVTVTDRNTSQAFGHGNSGSLVLAPHVKQSTNVTMDIFYNRSSDSDQTFTDLWYYCSNFKQYGSVVPVADGESDKTPDFDFSVQVQISGIAWKTSVGAPKPKGFNCPTN